jgi:hypothetical protein
MPSLFGADLVQGGEGGGEKVRERERERERKGQTETETEGERDLEAKRGSSCTPYSPFSLGTKRVLGNIQHLQVRHSQCAYASTEAYEKAKET